MKLRLLTSPAVFAAATLLAATTAGSARAQAPASVFLGSDAAATLGQVRAGDRIILNGSIKPVADNPATATPKQAALVRAELTEGERAQSVTFEVSLIMRGLEALRECTAADSRPTAAEMEANHLPAKTDFESLEKWLTEAGFTIKHRDAHRLAIFASGTVAQAQSAFQTRFAQVAFEGKNYLAAVTAPSVPASLHGILGVNGLQPFIHYHINSHRPAAGVRTNIDNQPPYLVSEILKAFNAGNTQLTGANEEIAIIIDVYPAADDLTAFWSDNNSSQTLDNIYTYDCNVSGMQNTDAGEATLDVEWSSTVAPEAIVEIFGTGSLSDQDTDNAYSNIAGLLKDGDRPGLHTISASYSGDEDQNSSSELQTDSQYFATIASYGVTILFASGDNGAFGHQGELTAEYPPSDPSVTAVGGVTVKLNQSTGALASLTGWSSDGTGDFGDRIGASGGGISQVFARPSWQKGTGVISGRTRLEPDVAASSDENEAGLLVLNGEAMGGANGTSWATPTWAGLVALLNEARANNNQASLGLLNPKIYPLIGSNSFYDITTGNNGHFGQNDAYSCTTGYDLVTGIGAPDFANLLTTLTAGKPTISSFSPTSGKVGTTVTINGTGFVAPLSVTFGGNVQAAGSFSSTKITATVPSGAVTGKITVTTSGGSVSTASNFTVTTSGSTAGTLGFGTSAYSVNENAGSITVHVLRSGGSTGTASVVCGTSGLSGSSGTDYTGTSRTLTWADGDTAQKAFTVAITDRGLTSGTKQFKLSLTSPNGATLGSPTTATVTINEKDPVQGDFTFSASTYSVNETAGSVTVKVNRLAGSTGAVSVVCGTSSQSASSGRDYTGKSQTLTWAAGDKTQKTFTVSIINRGASGGNGLTFAVKLSSPTGSAVLGSPSTATVTIH